MDNEINTITEVLMDDLHNSKISPDDPRLKLPSQKSRSLKKGPVIAISATLLTLILGAVALAMLPADNKNKLKNEAQEFVSQQFTIPESVRHGPGNDAPIMRPSVPDSIPKLGAQLPGDLGHAMVNKNMPQSGGQYQAQDPAESERQAAIKASPFFGGGNSSASMASSVSLGAHDNNNAQAKGGGGDYGKGQNMQDRKSDFLTSGGGEEKEYLSKGIRQPVSKYEVKAGAVISILLVTGINSDLPGNVIGMVKENLYDTQSGNYLLIPQGTRVLGRYDSMVSYGQKRVQVSWSRMIRPDGSSIVIENMPGVDLAGYTGYKDKVDNHYGKLVGGAVLSSLLSVGATVSQGNYTNADMSAQQQMAAAVGQNIASTGGQITRKNLDIQPTLIIRAGKSVNILVNKDMIISPYNTKS